MRLFVIIVFLLIPQASAFAYFDRYPPYGFKQGPPGHLEARSLIVDQGEYQDGHVTVQFHEQSGESFRFLLKDGEVVLDDTHGQEPPVPDAVYQADLDHNGFRDFIVISSFRGAGLGGHLGLVEIYLKEKEGQYHKISYETMAPGLEDFVDLKNDAKYEIIMTGYYSGKEHNFFSYNIYEFNGYKLVNADKKHQGFPKFVWLTDNPNDKDTLKLTDKEKKDHIEEKNTAIKYGNVPARK